MKKLFSLVLALALALTAFAAFAETAEDPTTGNYVIYNGTGEKVTELYLIDNLYPDAASNTENLAVDAENDGIAANEAIELAFTPENKDAAHGRLTLTFKTESGYEGTFATLSIEDAPITLLAADAQTGATNISFTATQVGAYAIYNLTGEKVTELFLIENESGEKSDNYVGEDGLAADASLQIYKTMSAAVEGHGALTLTFKTESGYEGHFDTLSIEVAPISLLSADGMTGATMISFTKPE